MLNLSKNIPFLKKSWAIIVVGENKATTSEAIFRVLRKYLRTKKIKEKPSILSSAGVEVLVFEAQELTEAEKLIKKTRNPILIVTALGDIPPDHDFFASDLNKAIPIIKLAGVMPPFGYLVLNFDDETVRDIKSKTSAWTFTFGFQDNADFRATDVKLNGGTNFKINHRGNTVPVWLNGIFGKEQIYSALAASVVGEILKINLVKISEGLKEYKSLPGKMRMIKGIDNTWILDDSESATAFSMIEALDILKELRTENFSDFKTGKKIAVLGDVIGIGKYTIEAHETIGEKVVESADLLFTIGPRAKFIASGAFEKGMSQEKIFQFDTVEKAIQSLREKIKKGDLVLVDGSKEMQMQKIIEALESR